MAATINDIAEKCHCSTTTVSKVLNHVGKISSAKTAEILKVAQECGYVRSKNAMSLASANKKSFLIGVVLHIQEERGITHELFSNLLNSFRIEMEKQDYDICFIRYLEDDSEISYTNLIESRSLDGILILSLGNNENVSALLNFDGPLVAFDYMNAKSRVSSTNTEGVASMVDYLVSLGHTRICYIAPDDRGISQERKEGFLLGLKRNGITFDKRMIVKGIYYNSEAAKIATDNALATGLNPTVIMYPDDYTAISGIAYLRTLGYKVPSDISVTGFDGLDIGRTMRPSIATTKQDSVQLGKTAARMLLDQLNNKPLTEKFVQVPTVLLTGESVRKL